MLSVVVQRVTNLADGVTQGLLAALAGPPSCFEQSFPGDELAGRFGEAQEDFDGLGREMRGAGSPRDLAVERVDAVIPQIKALK